MPKLMGTIRITANPGSAGVPGHFEVNFVPYAGKLNTRAAKASSQDDLVTLLMDLKISEDDATRYAGKARSQGVVLIPSIERTDSLLKDCGLLA